jgi:phosphate acetyltransferase
VVTTTTRPAWRDRLAGRAKADPRRVLLVEADDPRVLAAAHALRDEGLAVPVFLAGVGDGAADEGFEVIGGGAGPWFEAAVAVLSLRRRDASDTELREAVAGDPLLFGALLVAIGAVDVGVAGSIATTGSVVRAGLHGLGLRPGATMVSSAFLMQVGDETLTFADCAVVPEPTTEMLAEVAVDAARLHAVLTGEEPRVALLSFSTHGSSQHAAAGRVREAAALARSRAPELLVDGELQFDAAYVPAVAATKAPGSSVAGRANVFVFPDLAAGNIGYKIAERMAGARAVGPVMLGFPGWWLDLSRGCSTDDIVDLCVVGSVLAAHTGGGWL